jgi:excisionase family DNA binding protein
MADIPFRERIFCTINEAAQATGSGRSKIYELIKAGRIRTIRIDGRTKILVESLLNLGREDAA